MNPQYFDQAERLCEVLKHWSLKELQDEASTLGASNAYQWDKEKCTEFILSYEDEQEETEEDPMGDGPEPKCWP